MSEGAKDRKTVGEYLGEVTEKKTTIDTVHTETSTLEEEVKEYKSKFDAFDRQLDDRVEALERGKKEQSELFSDFNMQREKVDELID